MFHKLNGAKKILKTHPCHAIWMNFETLLHVSQSQNKSANIQQNGPFRHWSGPTCCLVLPGWAKALRNVHPSKSFGEERKRTQRSQEKKERQTRRRHQSVVINKLVAVPSGGRIKCAISATSVLHPNTVFRLTRLWVQSSSENTKKKKRHKGTRFIKTNGVQVPCRTKKAGKYKFETCTVTSL